MSEQIKTEEAGLLNELKGNKVLVIAFVVVLVGILGAAAFLGVKKYKEKKNVESAAAYNTNIFLMDSTDVKDDLSAYADEFEGYNGGSIASFMLARKYMDERTEESFEMAIAELDRVELEDIYIAAMAKGLKADCFSELARYEEAYTMYREAADHEPNGFTSAKYLYKAGLTAEELGNVDKALECYKQIKKDYPASKEARDIDKEIARTENTGK